MSRLKSAKHSIVPCIAFTLIMSMPLSLFGEDKKHFRSDFNWPTRPSFQVFQTTPAGDLFLNCCGEFDENSFVFSYNRVDGVFLGVKKPRETYRRHGAIQIYGGAGVGLESTQFQYHAVIERSFFPISGQFSIGAEFYDVTFSEDQWIIPTWENTLGAILIREDFRDYYRREGLGGYISQNFTRNATLKIGYYEERHRDRPNETNWSIFGGGKKFRLNPPVDSLKLKGLYGSFQIDTRGRGRRSRQGWFLSAEGEYFTNDFNGDTDFQRYIFEIRRYQPVSRGENLNMRVRVGESVGEIPVQKLFDLGGISSLRAFDYKAFTGDRLLLGNLEYEINWDRLDWSPDIPLISEFDVILFADAGLAWFKDDKEFNKLVTKDFFADVGVAIATHDGSFRVNFARRTDRAKDALAVTFRIAKPF